MNETYFLSIIDFLQLYDASKKFENAIKGKIMGREREVSAVSGVKYAERFTTYVKSIAGGVVGVMSEEEKQDLAQEEYLLETKTKEQQLQATQNFEEKRKKEKQERLSNEEKLLRAERQAIFLSKIRNGISVIKHPRKGRPSKRFLVLHQGTIGLIEHSDDMRSLVKKGFPLHKIKNVQKGQTTSVFARTNRFSVGQTTPVDANVCLSIIVDTRSLDIQCKDEEERDELAFCLLNLIDSNGPVLSENPGAGRHRRFSSVPSSGEEKEKGKSGTVEM